ncbi:hypothetical protein LTR53_005635 [Teratosphaeriaceae sp. CCFEE 6253]|nr:hypothetical protein LTR53_005635 [Teratosphaeriaceae sp. CCFEE 6253]
MPTESEVAVLPSPPVEASSSRASFTSCPPEEDREHHAPREPRIDTPRPDEAEAEAEVEVEETAGDAHMITQQPTPEPEMQVQVGASEAVAEPQMHEKGEHIEDAGIAIDAVPSVEASPDAPLEGGEVGLARSMSGADLSSSHDPLYLTFPRDRKRLPPSSTSSFLRPGSKFRGTQQSDRQVYEVQVEVKDVNMADSFLCGYLRIKGLTDDHPTLTTFFEGEIIGPKHHFKTAHASWGSSEKVDMQHWARFPAWRPFAKSAVKSASATVRNYQQKEHLFMRWKEYFLVPDHRVKTITGASFEGFYYICFNQCDGTVSGIYYHAKSEKYQQLELQHVDDKGCTSAVEFR